MRQLIYALRFRGTAEPAGSAGNVLRAATTAPSSAITCVAGPHGLAGWIERIAGGDGRLESDMILTGETSFQESGFITFGLGHRLAFSTIGGGYLGVSPDPAVKHGTAMWRVDGGEGQFTGATGLITSNFTLGPDLAIVDHQFGVLWLPEIDQPIN